LAEAKQAQRELHRLREALCLLSRELGALYPQGPIIKLAQQRVRDLVLNLDASLTTRSIQQFSSSVCS
jgi:hypothetical protein